MICGVLFSISSVADHVMTPKFFHVAFFYSGLIIQLYSNCFYGSQVFVAVSEQKKYAISIILLNALHFKFACTIQSEDIRQRAYFSNWQALGKYSPKIRKTLSMVMMRSKRACRLMAGKFAAVDLPTFAAVCIISILTLKDNMRDFPYNDNRTHKIFQVFKASYTYYTVLIDDEPK